jgi:hypothetical protein
VRVSTLCEVQTDPALGRVIGSSLFFANINDIMSNYNRRKENVQALKTKKRKNFMLKNYLTNIFNIVT